MEQNQTQFKIRTYGFCELAQLYFPNVTKESASKMFRIWITSSSILMKKMQKIEWKKNSKNLTPRQVKILIDHFDPP